MSSSSIMNIHKYIKTVNEYTDTNMQLKDMLSIGTSAITYVKPDEIQSAMLIGNPSSISGVSYYIVDEEASKELLKELFEGTHKEIGMNDEEEKNNEKTQEIKKAEMLESQTKNQSSETKNETRENDEPKPLTKEEELKIVVLS